MNIYLKIIKSDKVLYWSFIPSGISLLLFPFFIAFIYMHLPPLIPLYNKMPWGYERLGPTIDIFIPLLINYLIFIVNIGVAVRLHTTFPLLSKFSAITTLLCSLLIEIFLIQTIIIVL